MKLCNKLMALTFIATTITQAYGMSKLAKALGRTRASFANTLGAMKSAAGRSTLAKSASKIAARTSAASAKALASRLWSNKGNRVALGGLALGAVASSSAKADKQEERSVTQGRITPGLPHDSYCKQAADGRISCAPILFPDKFNEAAWDTQAPSIAAYYQPESAKPSFLTVAHLKREAALAYRAIYGGYFHVAPSSLKNALAELTPEQEEAINKYHQALVEKAPTEKRYRLGREVELLMRDQEKRTEILDNLRWLQEGNTIGLTSKDFCNTHTKDAVAAEATITAAGLAVGMSGFPAFYGLALLFPAAHFLDIYNTNSARNNGDIQPQKAGYLNAMGKFTPAQ